MSQPHQQGGLEPWIVVPGQLASDNVHEHIRWVLILWDGEVQCKAEVDHSNTRRSKVDRLTAMSQEEDLKQ